MGGYYTLLIDFRLSIQALSVPNFYFLKLYRVPLINKGFVYIMYNLYISITFI